MKRIGYETAALIVPDDLPDGAYFAMLDEVAGQPIDGEPVNRCKYQFPCEACRSRWPKDSYSWAHPRRFATQYALDQHMKDKHGVTR